MHMAGYIPKGTYVSVGEKAARAQIEAEGLELDEEGIALWFAAHKQPSPTAFALDMGIDPAELKSCALTNDLVRLALYRMISVAEVNMYTAVYGPRACIQRIEGFLPVASSVSDAELAESMFQESS